MADDTTPDSSGPLHFNEPSRFGDSRPFSRLLWLEVTGPKGWVASVTNPHTGDTHRYEIRKGDSWRYLVSWWLNGERKAFLQSDADLMWEYIRKHRRWVRVIRVHNCQEHLAELHLQDIMRGYMWREVGGHVDPTGKYRDAIWLGPPDGWLYREIKPL